MHFDQLLVLASNVLTELGVKRLWRKIYWHYGSRRKGVLRFLEGSPWAIVVLVVYCRSFTITRSKGTWRMENFAFLLHPLDLSLHVWYLFYVTLAPLWAFKIFNRCILHETTGYLFRKILGASMETWLVISFCRTPAQGNWRSRYWGMASMVHPVTFIIALPTALNHNEVARARW